MCHTFLACLSRAAGSATEAIKKQIFFTRIRYMTMYALRARPSACLFIHAGAANINQLI